MSNPPNHNNGPVPEHSLPDGIEVTFQEIDLNTFQVIDIREADEVASNPLTCAHLHIPMNDLLCNPHRLDKEKPYLLVCAAGVRTQYTANAFRSAGYPKVYSLIGGFRMIRD
jgi:rhodanese-related sulfurtransferase